MSTVDHRYEYSGNSDNNCTALAANGYLAWSIMLAGCYAGIQRAVVGQTQQLKDLQKRISILERGYQSAIKIAAQCQQDTAGVLNQQLERHALNPAILGVCELAEQIFKLNELSDNSDLTAVDGVSEQIQISAVAAKQQLDALDISIFTAANGQSLDYKIHQVCGFEFTSDISMHAKISEALTDGIFYRQVVLRKAKVKIYKLKDERAEQ